MEIFSDGPTRVMGILNVTPDSFSDGGQWMDHAAAVRHAEDLYLQGASIIDVGGESTRPGAERPGRAEELRRVLPVIEALAEKGIPTSVDTMRSEVAVAAAHAGACVINDVSGGLADPEMLAAVASLDVAYVSMHWRGHSFGMYDRAHYGDVVAEVCAELMERTQAAQLAGIDRSRIAIDPGFGFAKDYQHNWTLLAGMERVEALGYPVLVGVSRKGFLARPGMDVLPQDRDAATVAVTTLAAMRRVWVVRTHVVGAQVAAIAVAERLRDGAPGAHISPAVEGE